MVESALSEDKHLKFGVSAHARETTPFFDITPIQIKISNSIIKDGVKKHVEYQIVGNDKDGAFEIMRRYSEFDLLREALVKRWPGCFIPPIPSKQVMGNLEQKVIDERKKILNDFLFNVSKLKYLYYAEEFKLFIRGGKDYEKALGSIPKPNYLKLVEDFQLAFPDLSGKEINASLILKITGFESYLKRIKYSFENFEKMASNLAKERQNFTERFTLFHNFLMPEYEKNVFREYGGDEGLLFANPTDSKISSITGFLKDASGENYYENLADMLRAEDREIGAFLEALTIRKNYEALRDKSIQKEKEIQLEIQKTLAGKTTMKTLFSKGSKDDAVTTLEKNLGLTKKDTEELQFICDIITVILGYIEIDNFKAEKSKVYYRILGSLAASETQYQKLMSDFWTHISESQQLK